MKDINIIDKCFYIDKKEYYVREYEPISKCYICVDDFDHDEFIDKDFVEKKVKTYEQDKSKVNQIEDELEMMKINVNALRKNYRTNLIRFTKSLIITLQTELEQLENDPDYVPNGCGIIQGSGKTIDEYCAKLDVLEMIIGKWGYHE